MTQFDDPLWTILVFAVIILAAVWANIYYKSRSTTRRPKSKEDKERHVYAIDVVWLAQSGRVNSLYHAQNTRPQGDKSSSAEQNVMRAIEPIEWWTGVLAVATVLAAIFAGFTLSAIRGQLDVMEADKRPWIGATFSLDRPIILTDSDGSKGITVIMKVVLKNYGQSPAVNTWIIPMIDRHPYYTDVAGMTAIADKQRTSCASLAQLATKNPIGGFPVFPGDSYQVIRSTGITGGIYQTGAPPFFSIYGCVNYTYSGGDIGETWIPIDPWQAS